MHSNPKPIPAGARLPGVSEANSSWYRRVEGVEPARWPLCQLRSFTRTFSAFRRRRMVVERRVSDLSLQLLSFLTPPAGCSCRHLLIARIGLVLMNPPSPSWPPQGAPNSCPHIFQATSGQQACKTHALLSHTPSALPQHPATLCPSCRLTAQHACTGPGNSTGAAAAHAHGTVRTAHRTATFLGALPAWLQALRLVPPSPAWLTPAVVMPQLGRQHMGTLCRHSQQAGTQQGARVAGSDAVRQPFSPDKHASRQASRPAATRRGPGAGRQRYREAAKTMSRLMRPMAASNRSARSSSPTVRSAPASCRAGHHRECTSG